VPATATPTPTAMITTAASAIRWNRLKSFTVYLLWGPTTCRRWSIATSPGAEGVAQVGRRPSLALSRA
jgi:hypothetical protein